MVVCATAEAVSFVGTPLAIAPNTESATGYMSASEAEAVLGAISEGVLVLDLQSTISWANPAAEGLLRCSRRNLVGHSLENAMSENAWLTALPRRLDQEHPLVRAEGTLKRADDELDVVAHGATLTDNDGNVTGTVINIHATGIEVPLAEQEREKARLAELHRLVGQFGHELNNPLSGIRGAAQLLGRKLKASDTKDAGADDYAEMIVRQADRMAELITRLMSLEAPQTETTSVNIHKVLSDVLLLLTADADAKRVSVTTEFDPSLPDINADPDRLHQLFLNLTKNSVAALHDKTEPAIVIRTTMEHGFHVARDGENLGFIRVEVQDNGPGIDDDTRRHMFEPLYSRTPNGHGMGLAVARSIVSSHGGSISAENLAEGGTCLKVQLPVAKRTAASIR